MYYREIEQRIKKWLFKGKVLIFYGARQVGKTTLCKEIQKKWSDKKSVYFNCEDPLVQENLIEKSAHEIQHFFENAELVILDEAQSIHNIGRILKIFHDAFPEVQIIATGSSSFELANKINEPLTGRSIEFHIFPFAIQEITKEKNALEKQSLLSQWMLYGMYPEIVLATTSQKKELLMNITQKYLFKDILNFEGMKNAQLVYKILKALAYQIGSEVSFLELARLVGSSQHTVEKYIDILEKSFIIFRLQAFTNNKRKEIRKNQKIYFCDTGIRNALIQNFQDLDVRDDRGALFENFFLLEQMKKREWRGTFEQFYFWRSYDQQEVDVICDNEGEITAFELKWSDKKTSVLPPPLFKTHYPQAHFQAISPKDMCK